MQYTNEYVSPLGKILLAADEKGLTGLWFENQKYYARGLASDQIEKDLPVFGKTRLWLEQYFGGQEPDFLPPLNPKGTAFQMEVWELLLQIPYGETTTYGEIAQKLAQRKGLSQMSARAVGSAVGKNAISLIIPCHRVLGAGGRLTGYAGGLERKEQLLKIEQK